MVPFAIERIHCTTDVLRQHRQGGQLLVWATETGQTAETLDGLSIRLKVMLLENTCIYI